MVDRRSTPDILAALGAVPRDKTGIGEKSGLGITIEQSQDAALHQSSEQLEDALNRAVQSVASLGKIMGRRKLIDWLDEIRDTIVMHRERETSGTASIPDVVTWLKTYTGATFTISNYLVTGRVVEHPYIVDIWARIPEKFSHMDMWTQCHNRKSPVKRKDVLVLVRKAVDTFFAAHADKKDFWFDRLMLVSSTPFDPKAIAAARQYGVTCVLFDGATYQIQACKEWRRKPVWLKESEMALDKLQG